MGSAPAFAQSGYEASLPARESATPVRQSATPVRESVTKVLRRLGGRGAGWARAELGFRLANGLDGPADLEAVTAHFLQATESGDDGSPVALGLLAFNAYRAETGPASAARRAQLREAYAWFELAIARGRDDARHYLQMVTRRFDPQRREQQLAAARELARARLDRFAKSEDARLANLLDRYRSRFTEDPLGSDR